MGDSTRKQPRKSKLVERTYENIEEPSDTQHTNQRKCVAIRKIPYEVPEVKPPIELSVDIEEEGDDAWYTEMIEKEKQKKSKSIIKKSSNRSKVCQSIERTSIRKLSEDDLCQVFNGECVISVDTSTLLDTTDSYYHSMINEMLFLSPYIGYHQPAILNKNLAIKKKGRSNAVCVYYCMPCNLMRSTKKTFILHLKSHNFTDQLYFTIPKFKDNNTTLMCTDKPKDYINDNILTDVGIGFAVSISQDYETAINNVLTKWYCSDNQIRVVNGILNYKCYSCCFNCEFYSQFIIHLNEKHALLKLCITTEVLSNEYINVVASSSFKPTFHDLTGIPNKLSKYKCFKCKKIFDSFQGFKAHIKRIYVCAGCGVELPCYQMKRHEGYCNKFLAVFYPKMCPCKKEFLSSREMMYHQFGKCKFRRRFLVYSCLVCNYLAPSTIRLLIHQRLEHSVRTDIFSVVFKVCKCTLCDAKYVGSINWHYCFKRQDIVNCETCGMLFQNDFFFEAHRKAYPSKMCDYCDEVFPVGCAIIEHCIQHHGHPWDIKYKCTICEVLFDKLPNAEDTILTKEHRLEHHTNNSIYVFQYKKIYMPKVLYHPFGYHTGILPPQQVAHETNTDDVEELIDRVVIKKSNIISKSSINLTPKNSNEKSLQNKIKHALDKNEVVQLSKTISEEHNYDKTKSSDNDDYEIYDKHIATDIATEASNICDTMEDDEMVLCFVPNDQNEIEAKLEINVHCNKAFKIDEEDTKVNLNNIVLFPKGNVLDSFSNMTEDIVKCEPETETILVRTDAPIGLAPNYDDAKAGCSKDADYAIKSEVMSGDESDTVTDVDWSIEATKDDRPLEPKYPEKIGLGPQNNIISNLIFENEKKTPRCSSKRKRPPTKRKRAVKSKPNPVVPENTEIMSESSKITSETPKAASVTSKTDKVINQNVNIIEASHSTSETVTKTSEMQEISLITPETKSESLKTSSDRNEGITETEENAMETQETNKQSTIKSESTLTSPESSKPFIVPIIPESVKNTDDYQPMTVKVEIKEEIFEEYETDLIIFDDANSSNDGATDEKFVQVKPDETGVDCPSKPKIYFCNKCQFTGHHKEYKDHLHLCQKNRPRLYKEKRQGGKKQVLKYNCIKCHLECDDLRDYLKHLPSHGYEDNNCPCCDKAFDSLNKLAAHILTHIKADFKKICFLKLDNKPMELKKFRCCNCKMIVDQEDFFGHWQVHFDRVVVKKQPKDIRLAVIKAEAGDSRGMTLEEGVKREICEHLQLKNTNRKCILCDRTFTRTHDIKRHLIEHLTMDALCNRFSQKCMKCQICHEEFDYTALYKRHMRDHASLPLYQCQICDKSFSDSSNFGKHKKVHDVFEYVCDICRRKFQTKNCLIAHLKLHDQHKVISCEHCHKNFHFPSAYRKHKRSIHEKGVPRYPCTLCKTKFVSTKDKLNHEWREHGLRKNPVDCPLCNQGYRRVMDLKHHLKSMHALSNLASWNRTMMEEECEKRGISKEKINYICTALYTNTAKIIHL